jgi:transposase InsO family protein
VHGHESQVFTVSLSTVYRVLKQEGLVKKTVRKRNNGYVSAHTLMKEGFSLLCYDATRFVTLTNIAVWVIPVLLLPARYLLHIGYALESVTARKLTETVQEAYAAVPESLQEKLLAHSDRGSAMKATHTKQFIQELLNAPVHYGRPHTPDDEGWIESLIKTFKYHRDVPASFPQVDDVVQWLKKFPDLYNNDPHSSHKYVTPLQVLIGQKEVILQQRKRNLAAAQVIRHASWKSQQQNATIRQPQKESTLVS